MTGSDRPAQSPAQMIGQLLCTDERAWRRLLDLHVADRTGHCAGCQSSAGGAPVWPCTLRAGAEEARKAAGQ